MKKIIFVHNHDDANLENFLKHVVPLLCLNSVKSIVVSHIFCGSIDSAVRETVKFFKENRDEKENVKNILISRYSKYIKEEEIPYKIDSQDVEEDYISILKKLESFYQ